METTHDIISAAGGVEAVADRIGTSPANVRNHRAAGVLPASWYVALCNMTGANLPPHLFTFKGLAA